MPSAERNRNIRVALDANILITLLNMNRLELLAGLKGYEFYVPDPVAEEIHRKVQRERLRVGGRHGRQGGQERGGRRDGRRQFAGHRRNFGYSG